VQKQFDGVRDAEVRAIVHDNAADVFAITACRADAARPA
jgi:hypothetical protein